MTGEQGLFIGFVATMFTVVVATAGYFLSAHQAITYAVALVVWFGYVTGLSQSGVLSGADARPFGPAYILGPIIVYAVLGGYFFFRTKLRSLPPIPIWLLMGTQAFRVLVEIFIHRLWIDRVVPQTLTYSGANVDIYIGLSAPLFAWLSTKRVWTKVSVTWNVMGLIALANVVSRAILSAPGPLNLLHTDPPNRMFSAFPFMFIPAFFVPLAVTLHVIALRALLSRPLLTHVECNHRAVTARPSAD